MQRPMNNVHNVGKETWPPAHAGNRVTNDDLATRSGPYRQIPAAQGLRGGMGSRAALLFRRHQAFELRDQSGNVPPNDFPHPP